MVIFLSLRRSEMIKVDNGFFKFINFMLDWDTAWLVAEETNAGVTVDIHYWSISHAV